MVKYCDLKLKSSIKDPYLILYKSIALILSGYSPVAIDELLVISEKRDFNLVWPLVMIRAFQSLDTPSIK